MRLRLATVATLAALVVIHAQPAAAEPSAKRAPARSTSDPRIVTSEDHGWKFSLNPAGSPEARDYDDSIWPTVDLPHSWNGVDAAARRTPPVTAGTGGR